MLKDRFIPIGYIEKIGRKISVHHTDNEDGIFWKEKNLVEIKEDKPKHAIKLPVEDSVRDLI